MKKKIMCPRCNMKKTYSAKGFCKKCYCLEYYYKNREREIKRKKEWRKNSKERERNRLKKRDNRLKNKISKTISRRIRGGINDKNFGHWEDLVGYSLKDLKKHLEKQFKKGMSWKNYGSYWHIDHRTPLSWFKFKSYQDEDFKKCWALDNLQPKLKKENLNKNNRYAEPTLLSFKSTPDNDREPMKAMTVGDAFDHTPREGCIL